MSRATMQHKPPTFKQPYLRSLMVCSCFKLSNSALSKYVKTLDDTDERETRFESSEGPAWMRVRVGRRTEGKSKTASAGRYQIDCALESCLDPARAKTTPPNDWDEVRQHLELVFKQKADVTCCKGRFWIPEPDLPVGGFARLLLELSASTGRATMNLTGASFDVQGCGPIEEVKWSLKTRKGRNDGGELDLTITAYPKPNRFAGELEKIAQMFSKGVQELMFKMGK